MNCTYKINKYRMSLFIIDDQTVLHTSFYVVFCFTAKKIIENYCWILTQLRALYMRLNVSNSRIIVIDMKKDFMLAMQMIFSSSSHLLCIWHINNNVVVNCKRSFSTKKAWFEFHNHWKSMIYAHSKKEFWENWRIFTNKYHSFYEECVKYLLITYITNYRQRFVKCYNNKMLHFDITVSSRDERKHAVLKRHLDSSIDDLKTMIDEINFLLMNEYHNYLLKFEEAKMRLSMKLNKSIYQRLIAHVTSHVLKMIDKQYKLLINQSIALSFCTNVFTIIIELSCNHRIQNRLFDEEFLTLKNVHSHWK
jgi:hypothetical protein